MEKEKRILFGLDDSDFSRQASLETGNVIKNNDEINMTLFHGVPDPDIALLSKLTGQDPLEVETHRELWITEAQKVLEKAKDGLVGAGLDPKRLSTVLEPKCSDPADALLKLADAEEIENIAVGRWGKATVSRQVIGSVTYRLSQLTNHLTLWVVDPRICSHDVLVGLTGAPISRRIVDYTLHYFAHLKESRFTFFHVIPPVPPQYWHSENVPDTEVSEAEQKMVQWHKEYMEGVEEAATDAKNRLIQAGIPEQKVVFKFQRQKSGIARDMLVELEEGDHGILVIGRKGFKDIKEFGLGSKANKLLLTARAFIVCLVS
jgi:nucleotide-binding universal stress UspA family protein